MSRDGRMNRDIKKGGWRYEIWSNVMHVNWGVFQRKTYEACGGKKWKGRQRQTQSWLISPHTHTRLSPPVYFNTWWCHGPLRGRRNSSDRLPVMTPLFTPTFFFLPTFLSFFLESLFLLLFLLKPFIGRSSNPLTHSPRKSGIKAQIFIPFSVYGNNKQCSHLKMQRLRLSAKVYAPLKLKPWRFVFGWRSRASSGHFQIVYLFVWVSLYNLNVICGYNFILKAHSCLRLLSLTNIMWVQTFAPPMQDLGYGRILCCLIPKQQQAKS